jgi:acetylornithine deacetylase/succinyl-diaminopimelate desuccinylase-like protein
MVFVPCRDGISHHPDELADPEDAALAAEIILRAIASLQ